MIIEIRKVLPFIIDDSVHAQISTRTECDCGREKETVMTIPIVKRLHFVCSACDSEMGVVDVTIN